MRTLWGILRVFSYIYETTLCVMGLLVCAASFTFGLRLHLQWLPWTPDHLFAWLLAFSLAGLIAVGLAVSAKSRLALVLFSAAIVYVLLRGLFLSSQYRFSSPTDFKKAAWLSLGALAAFLGSWPVFLRRR